MTSGNEHFLSSQHASTELIRVVKVESEFSTTNLLHAVKEERSDVRKTRDDTNKAKLEVIVKNINAFDRRLFLYAKQTGSCMDIWGTTVTSTVLSAMVFRNFLCVSYNVTPPP